MEFAFPMEGNGIPSIGKANNKNIPPYLVTLLLKFLNRGGICNLLQFALHSVHHKLACATGRAAAGLGPTVHHVHLHPKDQMKFGGPDKRRCVPAMQGCLSIAGGSPIHLLGLGRKG